jgi:tetratricopeptide (TPR) repeat protein
VFRFAELVAPARDGGLALHLDHRPENDDFLPPLGLKEALKTLFASYRPAQETRFASLAELEGRYAELSDLYGFAVAPAEMVMIRSAVDLARDGRPEAAGEILRRATELYPRLVDAWWQLAGLAAARGDLETAVRLYRHCQEIDPGMASFVERRIASLHAAGD